MKCPVHSVDAARCDWTYTARQPAHPAWVPVAAIVNNRQSDDAVSGPALPARVWPPSLLQPAFLKSRLKLDQAAAVAAAGCRCSAPADNLADQTALRSHKTFDIDTAPFAEHGQNEPGARESARPQTSAGPVAAYRQR